MAHRDRPPSPLARVRRVPWSMSDECAAHRRSGGWRAAYAAAGVTVDVDLDDVMRTYPPAEAAAIADQLHAAAPDLLRQYLSPYRAWTPGNGPVVLSDQLTTLSWTQADRAGTSDLPALVLFPEPPGPALRLAVIRPSWLRWYRELPVWCWRADAVEQRRAAHVSRYSEAQLESDGLAEGALSPDDLHPLLHDALYPDRVQRRSAYAWSWEPTPVRCGSAWHELRLTDGRLVSSGHSSAEIDRELALGGLSGPMVRCASVVHAWRTGTGGLPKRLRWQRADLFEVAARGHGDEVAAALAAGFDRTAVDGEGAGFLHYAAWLGGDLLPELLSAGLSPDRRDKRGRTPLHWAYAAARPDVVEALLGAGANPSIADDEGLLPKARTPKLHDRYAKLLRQDAEPPKQSMVHRLLRRSHP
ncbi:ankyrin repeat domain-containing protein [Hamadaea sp. NPDC051192]|uniref:ankyrin repeat domain-containing protein n=1 Tax=Hamadaea sp. NPDC051192 TaxID=3154940 RepID=UPI003430B945